MLTRSTRSVQEERGLQIPGGYLVRALYGSLQAMKLYPRDNPIVRKALEELNGSVAELRRQEGGIELRLASGCFFVNGVRLRFDMSNRATTDALRLVLASRHIGAVEISGPVEPAEWAMFVELLLQKSDKSESFAAIRGRLESTGVRGIAIHPETQAPQDAEQTDSAKHVYMESVRMAREVLEAGRMGRVANVRKLKRAVQSIVDQVLTNQTALLGMTTLREYDEYTFTHSVNVCILSAVLGQKLGLNKVQLYEIGLCGLFHDIGKLRLDCALINKPERLTADEWSEMKAHTREGLLELFRMRGFADIPFRPMLAAYEHHMKVDLSGYPEVRRPRKLGLFTRIVSIVDIFDAATSVRSYNLEPWPPDKVLKVMRDGTMWSLDPVLVKAFINITGIYPVGTVVILNTRAFGVVIATNVESPLSPVVKVVTDESGKPLRQPLSIDLAATPAVKVLKCVDAALHGIDASRYLVS